MGQTNDKRARSRPAPKPQVDRSEFVNYDLSTEQLKECKAWAMADGDLWNETLAVTDDGYSLSISRDDRNDCYLCILRARVPGVNSGLLLSGRGSTPAKAFKQAVFKHHALEHDWTSAGSAGRAPVDD